MPWAVNQLAIEAAHYLLAHRGDYALDLPALMAERERMSKELSAIDGITVYPSEYFCPISTDGEIHISEQTRTIHHYAQSWLPASHIWLRKIILAVGGTKLKRHASRLYARLKSKK